MLRNTKILNGFTLDSRDGEIGRVKEFLFDDHHWTVRYLVADTGTWLAERMVLISPYALGAVNEEEQHITVELTKKQIEDSPSLNSDKPVSQQFENAYFKYYGWPMYWDGSSMWGPYPYIARDNQEWRESTPGEKTWDSHLRSAGEVTGYHIQASDGEIGHVEDFIIDDETWAIRYLVIDTRNWWTGKKVLISPQWIDRISWDESEVFVNLSREAVKKSPEFTKDTLTREYETDLYRSYGRPGYWI